MRLSWVCRVHNVLQAAVGDAVDGDPFYITSIAGRISRELPLPGNEMEEIYVRRALPSFTSGLSQLAHSLFHLRFGQKSCQLLPPQGSDQLWLDRSRTIEQVLHQWGNATDDWFRAEHSVPPALVAQRLIQEGLAKPHTNASIAKQVGASRSTLLRQFGDAFGMSPTEYLTRMRVREGLRQVRSSETPLEGTRARGGVRERPSILESRTTLHRSVADGDSLSLREGF